MIKKFIAASAVILVILLVSVIAFLVLSRESTISKSEAIEAIKQANIEFESYPSDDLPPKVIKTEEDSNGWYVAFVQEGSGIPVISATCFFIDEEKQITNKGSYEFEPFSSFVAELDIKTCTLKDDPTAGNDTDESACGLETCHGYLDVSCGSNVANVCTQLYQIGDKCLQYVDCGVVNGSCKQIENTEFESCKSCVQECESKYADDIEKQFSCEAEC